MRTRMRSNNHRQLPFCSNPTRFTYEVLITLILLILVLPEVPYAEAQSKSNRINPNPNPNSSPGGLDFAVWYCFILGVPLLLAIIVVCLMILVEIAKNILTRYAGISFNQRPHQHGLQEPGTLHRHRHRHSHANLSTAQERGALNHHHENLGAIFVYSEVKGLNIAAGGGGELACPVCLSDFHDQDVVRLLTKCNHAFHPHCIDVWLQIHTTCPLCRANVLAADSVYRTVLPTPATTTIEPQNYDAAATALSVDHRDEQQDAAIETRESTDVVLELNTRLNPFLPRSNSTGHSLTNEPGENTERFTLRLPVEVRIQIPNPELHRSTSFDLVVSCQY